MVAKKPSNKNKEPKKAKEVTLESLALLIRESNKSLENKLTKKIDDSIDNLAIITKKGFDDLENRLTERMDDKIGELKKEMRFGFDRVESKLESHDRRIDKNTDDIRIIKTKLKVK